MNFCVDFLACIAGHGTRCDDEDTSGTRRGVPGVQSAHGAARRRPDLDTEQDDAMVWTLLLDTRFLDVGRVYRFCIDVDGENMAVHEPHGMGSTGFVRTPPAAQRPCLETIEGGRNCVFVWRST